MDEFFDGEGRWNGFRSPSYTPVPDEFFDVLAPTLKEGELRVLLYIMRRTFGFKKDSDAISYTQMMRGITTKDGRVLDRGTGMQRKAVVNACASLVERRILKVRKALDEDGDNEINVYSLVFREDVDNLGTTPGGVVSQRHQGGIPRIPGVGSQGNPQQTGTQETVQETVVDSDGSTRTRHKVSQEGRRELERYLADFGREFADQAAAGASLARAVRLWQRSGLDLDAFVRLLYTARERTQQYTPKITKQAPPSGPWPRKNKMPYFFEVLKNLIEEGRG